MKIFEICDKINCSIDDYRAVNLMFIKDKAHLENMLILNKNRPPRGELFVALNLYTTEDYGLTPISLINGDYDHEFMKGETVIVKEYLLHDNHIYKVKPVFMPATTLENVKEGDLIAITIPAYDFNGAIEDIIMLGVKAHQYGILFEDAFRKVVRAGKDHFEKIKPGILV